jgi:DNA repair exonuclease SbcCD ATPase subunit
MLRAFAWMLIAGFVLPAAALAQETPATPPAGTTPLGVRQQRVERMMEELERKFRTLRQAIEKNEPDRAKRLEETYNKAKELLIQKRMGDITKLLDQARLDSATDGQKAVLADIRTLLEILLDEKSDREKAREEFERLSQWKKEIENLITQERGEKRESDKVANKEKTLADMQAKIKALEQAIAAQKEVNAATEAARADGIQGLGKIAPQQAAARQKAESIANQIAKEAGDERGPFEPKPADGASAGEPKPGEAKPGEAKPGEGKPGEGKPGEGKPGEGKPGEGKPGEGKPGEGKPGEGKPGEGKPGEGKPGEGKPGEGKPGEGQPAEGQPAEGAQPPETPAAPNRPAEPGEKPLKQAVENQEAAEGNLSEGKGKAAQQDEQTALANLERALAELKREESRIASLPPEAFEKMAKKQDDIANQTAKLEQKMDEAAKGGSQSGGGQSGEGGGGGKPQPGQQKVAKAQKSMQQASGGLRKQDPNDASRQQGKAIKELEEALQEIEERLNQLREETQLEKLARLERRFREMLSVQQRITAQTAVFDKKRQDSGGNLARPDRLAVGALGGDESRMDAVLDPMTKQVKLPMGLAGHAQQALDLIIDDGTSVVFPDVVEQLRDDLISVGKLLTEHARTDQYTQTLQKEIETTLEELIEALQQAQSQKEGGGGGGGGGGEPPLLPNSAELKLLRSAQLRINRRTAAIEAARPKEGPLEAPLKDEAQTIATRQAEIAEMTIRILERTTMP